jgi:hypothetical protein
MYGEVTDAATQIQNRLARYCRYVLEGASRKQGSRIGHSAEFALAYDGGQRTPATLFRFRFLARIASHLQRSSPCFKNFPAISEHCIRPTTLQSFSWWPRHVLTQPPGRCILLAAVFD